ncbi:hypothetical protein OPT61_g1512 [Boeremia exigua]|uniref:Uncharacterized protein n=1 Tax=Boeremia exigua TaxID=749465 RepID=A0ACC2IPW7_9PLEO|nr:hypothetical protein OPT61_g1512 [Boeremia exigua]
MLVGTRSHLQTLSLPYHVRSQSTAAASDPGLGHQARRTLTKRYGSKSLRGSGLLEINRKTDPNYDYTNLKKLDVELKWNYDQHQALRQKVMGTTHVRMEVAPPSQNNAVIRVENKKLVVNEKRIPNIWLRDNCQCSSCMHKSTKQRLQDTFAIPRDLSINSASIATEETPNARTVDIEWSDGHKSRYTQLFLANATASFERRSIVRQGLLTPKLWTSAIAEFPPRTTYEGANSKKMRPVLRSLRTHGFCYIDNTPFDTPDATETLLRHIAFIRETHYGGFYDFTADLASQDTAYTNIALEAHTDNTYFSEPAGLQAFHLLSHTDGAGGASLLVDGFNAALELARLDPAAYRILSTVNVHAHASGNDGISIQPYRGFPVLEHDPATGDLLRVRWNSADRASIELPIEEVETWYDAARKFDAVLKKRDNEYWEQLVPGRVLVFDNWRVLHGRSSFTGKRRICGGYINRDDWMSRFKMEMFGKEQVMGDLASS